MFSKAANIIYNYLNSALVSSEIKLSFPSEQSLQIFLSLSLDDFLMMY